jgi:exodeoxyribonuclease VII small subunit
MCGFDSRWPLHTFRQHGATSGLASAARIWYQGQMNDLPPDIAELPFEDALAELETLVRHMESGTIRLDEAVTAYERGMLLRTHCSGILEQARLRVELISRDAAGDLSLQPFPV